MSRIQTTSGLLGYSTTPVIKQLRNWWLRRKEAHYMMCADVEKERANQALANQSYFHKQAALARSGRI
jgi:hypothetical protein